MNVKKIVAVAVIVIGVLVAGIFFSDNERNVSLAVAEDASVSEVSSYNKAPDFTLQNQDENPVSLSDYKNKRVALWFYPKASTPG